MSRASFDPSCGFDISATTIRDPDALDRIAEWGYRLVRHESGMLFLHEAFYDGNGRLLGLSLPPTRLCGESLEAVRDELEWMRSGLEEPVLEADALGASAGTFGRYGWEGEAGAATPRGPFLGGPPRNN